MVLSNYHCHSLLCDGNSSLEDMTAAAFQLGFQVLGFSAHAPLPFPSDWNMAKGDMGEYQRRIQALKLAYAPRMEVLLGYEMDWIEDVRGPRSPFWLGVERDFAIGSVHYLRSPLGASFTVDDTRAKLLPILEKDYGNDGRRLCQEYYGALKKMISEGGFDILGHLDLIKKNNQDSRIFNEEEPWYRDAVMECLEALEKTQIVVEINTGGIARGKISDCYPSSWILKEMASRGLRLTLNSDAHAPEHLLVHREQALAILKAAGYREAWYLSGGKWQASPIDSD